MEPVSSNIRRVFLQELIVGAVALATVSPVVLLAGRSRAAVAPKAADGKEYAFVVDVSKCIGCKACLAACPYGARFIHPDGYADKCTFCMHRVERGLAPACVDVCPTRCMHFGDLDDPESEVSRLIATRRHFVLKPDAGTRPRIFYLE